MTELKIHRFDKVIPRPPRKRGRTSPINFSDMEIGKPIFIEGKSIKNFGGRIYAAAKETGYKFSMLTLSANEAKELFEIQKEGLGIWRMQ